MSKFIDLNMEHRLANQRESLRNEANSSSHIPLLTGEFNLDTRGASTHGALSNLQDSYPMISLPLQ